MSKMMPVGKGLLSPAEHAILVRRLAGDDAGSTAAGSSYGGLPLSDAFTAVAEYMLEQGIPVTEGELVKVVRDAGAFPLKTGRVLAAWGSWEAFTRAVLLLMKQCKIITYQMYRGISKRGDTREGGTWALHSLFTPGKPYVLISIPDRDLEIGFTAWSPAEKEKQNRKLDYTLQLRALRASMDQDGILLADMDWAFSRILTRLEKGGTPRKRHHPQVGFEVPPENQPEVMRMCTKCENDYPLTTKYFPQYSSRGFWYWNRECIECDTRGRGRSTKGRGIGSVTKSEVERVVNTLTINDTPPAAREVMRELGRSDDRVIRKYWDELAAEGRVRARVHKETVTW